MKTSPGFLLVVILLANLSITSGRGSPTMCSTVKLFRAHGVDVWYTPPPSLALYYKAGFAIDADGAFRAYHPSDNLGLDSLAHAGHPGNWWALVTDNEEKNGRPVVQGDLDPAPGYYVSTTALFDRDNPNVRDPHRYVDAATTPYVVLHPKALKFAELGDFSIVVNLQNGKVSGAIVADESARNLPIGEGSIALANALGINSNPRNGGKRGDVAYVIFEHSGNGKPRGLQEIEANSKRLFLAWGGLDRLNTPCARFAAQDCVAVWGSSPSGFHRWFAKRPVRSETNIWEAAFTNCSLRKSELTVDTSKLGGLCASGNLTHRAPHSYKMQFLHRIENPMQMSFRPCTIALAGQLTSM